MIILTILVELENLIAKMFEIGFDKIEMVVPENVSGKVLFEIYYKEKV